uniref:Ribonuclease H-like domain-containing protein n=1 Tax=Tanacetum cinerariifolium TaxID=118510 RepID=A0A699H4M2_TANCI|nr:ribonuclease H-like domain-containing protein [Tanacetum cinerariifolium]
MMKYDVRIKCIQGVTAVQITAAYGVSTVKWIKTCEEIKISTMEAGAITTMTAKLPILNLREYDLWLMKIEQYFLMTDYSLWEVIKNGNKVLTKPVGLNNLSDAMICAFLASKPNTSQLAKEDLEQIDPDDLEEIDLH